MDVVLQVFTLLFYFLEFISLYSQVIKVQNAIPFLPQILFVKVKSSHIIVININFHNYKYKLSILT